MKKTSGRPVRRFLMVILGGFFKPRVIKFPSDFFVPHAVCDCVEASSHAL